VVPPRKLLRGGCELPWISDTELAIIENFPFEAPTPKLPVISI
jgi:hypothetical protein